MIFVITNRDGIVQKAFGEYLHRNDAYNVLRKAIEKCPRLDLSIKEKKDKQ